MKMIIILIGLIIFMLCIMIIFQVIIDKESPCKELKTTPLEWEECRNIAWEKCFENTEELLEESSDNFIGWNNYDLLMNLRHDCWEGLSQLCSTQFDMDKVARLRATQ